MKMKINVMAEIDIDGVKCGVCEFIDKEWSVCNLFLQRITYRYDDDILVGSWRRCPECIDSVDIPALCRSKK